MTTITLQALPSQSPIACTLNGTEQSRRQEAMQELVNASQQKAELADGYALKFETSLERVQTLTDFIMSERECCPFFTFALLFEPDSGGVWLQICGGTGVKAALAILLQVPTEVASQG